MEKAEKNPVQKVIDNAETSAYSDGCKAIPSLNPNEQAVMDQLNGGERLVDDVIAETGLTTGKILALLTMLELKGIVKRLPGKRISLK